MIGYKPDLKSLGKRSALNAHAAFDVAGAGNTIGYIGAPVLDPTREGFGGEIPPYLLDQCQTRKLSLQMTCIPLKKTVTLLSCFYLIVTHFESKTEEYDTSSNKFSFNYSFINFGDWV